MRWSRQDVSDPRCTHAGTNTPEQKSNPEAEQAAPNAQAGR